MCCIKIRLSDNVPLENHLTVACTGSDGAGDRRRIGRFHLWLPLPGLNAVLFHCVRSVHAVQFEIEPACVANGLT